MIIERTKRANIIKITIIAKIYMIDKIAKIAEITYPKYSLHRRLNNVRKSSDHKIHPSILFSLTSI